MKNIDISDPGFPGRLTAARERVGLSKTGLAERAGLAYRTVHNLESGRLTKAQEKTLLLLCEALGLPFSELVAGQADVDPGPDAPPTAIKAIRAAGPRRRWLLIACLVAIVGAALILMTDGRLRSRAEIETTEYGIVAREPLFRRVLWRVDTRAPRFLILAPWSDDQLIVAVTLGDGSRLLCLDRKTGREIWRTGPDFARTDAAFGYDAFARHVVCSEVRPADIDGDGQPELLTIFRNAYDYAHCLAIVDRTGALRHQYATWGRISHVQCRELDLVPGQEIVLTAADPGPDRQRAALIVLDKQHFAGAAVDPARFPGSTIGDSSRARVVFPEFPDEIFACLNCRVPVIGEPVLQRLPGTDDARLVVIVLCEHNVRIQMELDDHLALVRIIPVDHLDHALDDACNAAWLPQYLADTQRYEAGRAVPFADVSVAERETP